MSKKSVLVLRIGLAIVFLTNALTAYFAPSEFKELVEGSFVASLFPAISSSLIVTLVLINDSLLFLILLFNPKFIKYALIWASIYIVLVMIVFGVSFEALEHVGFLAMAIALFLELKQS